MHQICTNHLNNHSQICYIWHLWCTVASFTPWKVIWGHFMASSGHRTFLPIIFHRKEMETWEKCQSVRLIKTHQLIWNMIYLGHFATLTSGDLRSNLQVDLSRSKSILFDPAWREEHNGVKIIPVTDVVQKLLLKTIKKRTYDIWWPLVRTVHTIDWTANLKAEIDSWCSGLSFGSFEILLACTCTVSDIIVSFLKNSPILGKFDLFNPCDLNFDFFKNHPYDFCSTWYGLSNAVYRFSMRCVIPEISRGCNQPPPRPVGF